nr:hypothetical protein [Mucilaginibacter sp. X4EP1]
MSLHYIINDLFEAIVQLMMVGLFYIAMGLKYKYYHMLPYTKT